MPSQPSFHGRPLPRPEEELQDQGLAFDLGTLLDRRRMLALGGVGLVSVGLAACTDDAGSGSGGGAGGESAGEIPEETDGPYPGDGSNGPDALETAGIIRSDITRSFGEASGIAAGVPMTLELTVTDLANGGAPFTGVAVYVWQCDMHGEYSMYTGAAESENYLRGVQIADANGVVRFTSIFPACYPGRWPHIHFEIYPDQASITDHESVIATSQVALPEATCDAVYATAGYEESVQTFSEVSLEDDSVFRDDLAALQMGAATGSATEGFAVTLAVGVDTRTAPRG